VKGSILAINSGSPSARFASFDSAPGALPKHILRGEADGLSSVARLLAWEHEGVALEERVLEAVPGARGSQDPDRDHQAALDAILAWLGQHPSQG
jgi:hypothetical protein